MTNEEKDEHRRRRASIQRTWRWKSAPLLYKRLPGGKRQWVIKKFDQETMDRLSDAEIRSVFERMGKMNRWLPIKK